MENLYLKLSIAEEELKKIKDIENKKKKKGFLDFIKDILN